MHCDSNNRQHRPRQKQHRKGCPHDLLCFLDISLAARNGAQRGAAHTK